MKSLHTNFPPIPAPRPAPSLTEEIADLTRQIDKLAWKRDFIFRVLADRVLADPQAQPLISPDQSDMLRMLATHAARLATEAGNSLTLQWGVEAKAAYPVWLAVHGGEADSASVTRRFSFASPEKLLDFLWHWCFESAMTFKYLAQMPDLYAQWEALRSQLPVPKPDSTD